LIQNASPTRSSDWLNIVNLFSDAKRYLEARDILSKAINKFPELENNRSQLKQFDQLFANQMFDAAQKAQDAGQYEFATYILESINKSGIETELKVQRKLETMSTEAKETAEVLRWIQEDIAKLPDPAAKAEFESLLPEITRYLRPDTALRFADYRRRRGDANLKPEQLAAIAISGWIYGSGVGEDNTSVVSSGVKARRIIKEYLESPVKNDQLIEQLSQLESGSARLVASLVANMPPPVSTPDEASVQELVRSTTDPTEDPKPVTVPGRYIIDVPLRGAMQGKTVRYMVQLPPEYNPFRRYPCVLTLPSEYSNAEEQILWWSGPFAPNSPGKRCLGEASKSGYIVVSPAWAEPKQPSYNYTENEHAMVLAPLRDAMRRFSIDSDHVFVSGHFMGADAAWDVALAHPDLWAGSIMIGAGASKYIIQYWENAYYVPSYFVMGELDGRSSSNFKVWDNLLGRKQIDCIIANYRGRGLDHFQEELPRIMDWMSLPSRTRNFVPKGFTAITSRAGDRFFWWFETQQLLPDKLVHPLLYAAGVEYKVESVLSKEANSIQMRKAPAKNYTIWLSPEMVDFSRTIIVENKRLEPKPSVRTLLEDVRARADRQHPFWMKVEMPK
jgi:pimeloyl-ACP methyl ester carboxylesterase